MRSPATMDTIQIELTSACVLRCSNCTRMCGTHKVPFFMEPELFRSAIDSLVEYSQQPQAIVGFMGGEPLLHPQFEEFCGYALTKIPREKLGLWSTFPAGGKYPAYREVICKTFGSILLNDHSREDILHAPVLMAAEEYFRKPCDRCSGSGKRHLSEMAGDGPGQTVPCSGCEGKGTITDDVNLFAAIDNCWVQNTWSASINPKGAFFCEVAAALSDLFDGPPGWAVEPGWWKRTSKDFKEQMDYACRMCGAAMPLTRIRNSQDPKDDVSAGNLERLKAIGSRKVAHGEFALRETFEFDQRLVNNTYPNQTYKDEEYRKGIAARYRIGLKLNQRGYWEPYLMSDEEHAYTALRENQRSLYQIAKANYTEEETRSDL
jgi:hypothetical protein